MAEVIDCTFQDSYGSALGVVNSHVVLRGSRFLNNCRMCSNGRCGVNSKQGPRCYGGGVYVGRSNLNITGSNRFSGNSATYGGGVSAFYYSNVYISGNTTFSGNSASVGGGVSAFYYSIVHISGNTAFSDNSASDGGGVSAWYTTSVYISGNTTFIGNSGTYAWWRSQCKEQYHCEHQWEHYF